MTFIQRTFTFDESPGNFTQVELAKALEQQFCSRFQLENPDAYDNQGFLKNAPNEEIRQKIIQSRINHLKKEIQTFKDNIEKIKNGTLKS